MLEKFHRLLRFIKNHYGWVYFGLVVIAYSFVVYMSYRPESF
jgi:membrane-bound acyltransferase YfiQ involved in biofilm formation